MSFSIPPCSTSFPARAIEGGETELTVAESPPCEYRSAALPVPVCRVAGTVSPPCQYPVSPRCWYRFAALKRGTRRLTDRVHAWQVASTVSRPPTGDPKHSGPLQRAVAVVHAVHRQTRPRRDIASHHLGRESAVLHALLDAELKQHDNQAEVAQQVPARPRLGELSSHPNGERDPRVVVDQQVQQADDSTGATVVLPLVPDNLGSLQHAEQQLDAALAHLPTGGELVIGKPDDALPARMSLLVGQLAQQRVKADRAKPPRSAGLVANRLDGAHTDLEERQLAPVADRDGPIRQALGGHRNAGEVVCHLAAIGRAVPPLAGSQGAVRRSERRSLGSCLATRGTRPPPRLTTRSPGTAARRACRPSSRTCPPPSRSLRRAPADARRTCQTAPRPAPRAHNTARPAHRSSARPRPTPRPHVAAG